MFPAPLRTALAALLLAAPLAMAQIPMDKPDAIEINQTKGFVILLSSRGTVVFKGANGLALPAATAAKPVEAADTTLVTSSDAFATFALSNGAMLHMGPNTAVKVTRIEQPRIPEAPLAANASAGPNSNTALKLLSGSLWIQDPLAQSGSTITVSSVLGVCEMQCTKAYFQMQDDAKGRLFSAIPLVASGTSGQLRLYAGAMGNIPQDVSTINPVAGTLYMDAAAGHPAYRPRDLKEGEFNDLDSTFDRLAFTAARTRFEPEAMEPSGFIVRRMVRETSLNSPKPANPVLPSRGN